MEENKQKFQQTNDTPCMQEPLRSELGSLGNTASCQEILNGTFTAPLHTPAYTREFLNQLLQAPNLTQPPPQATITKSMFRRMKKMSEFTSAGISDLYFGHMKACAMNEFLSNFESSLAHIPYIQAIPHQGGNMESML
jgi:hypothetical protein